MPQGRALAYGLIALGVGLAVLILLWLGVTAAGGGLEGGGLVLGLILLFILGGPPIGAGLYLLSTSAREEAVNQSFDVQRRVLDADRILRRDMARDFRQQADLLAALPAATAGASAGRLRDLAEDLDHPAYDQPGWYDTVSLDAEDRDQVQRYNDLLVEEQRRIERAARAVADGGQPDAAAQLNQALDRWEQQFQRRQDILLRGRRAPSASAADLLRSRPATRGAEALAALKRGDAVSYETNDYIVETTTSYFSGGRTWRIHTLRAEKAEAYLYVGPGGLSLAVLTPTAPPTELGARTFGEGECLLTENGSATGSIAGPGGTSEGLLVDYWRYSCGENRMGWVERWQDTTPRAFLGAPANPAAFEVWPS